MRYYGVGALLNICGSLLVNFGTNIIKLSHNKTRSRQLLLNLNDFENDEAISYCESPQNLWLAGMSLFFLGGLLNFASFSFAAQSLLAALGGVQFFSNVVFARFILKEPVSKNTVFATCVIVTGIFICVVFSNHATRTFTKNDLVMLYDWPYIAFLASLALFVVCLQLVYKWYTYKLENKTPLYGTTLVRPVCFSFVSASVGTQAVLQSKCLSELLKHAVLDDTNIFEFWETYAIFFVFLLGSIFWIRRLNESLKLFDGLLIVPVMQVCWTCLAILQGGLYFKEFASFSRTQFFGFLGGVCLIVVGVYILTLTTGVGTEHSDYLYVGRGLLSPTKQTWTAAGNNRSSIDASQHLEMFANILGGAERYNSSSSTRRTSAGSTDIADDEDDRTLELEPLTGGSVS
jgi:hypothetical protein